MINPQDQQTYSANEIEMELKKEAPRKSYYVEGDERGATITGKEAETTTTEAEVTTEYSKESQESDRLKLDIKEKEELLTMRRDWSVFFKKIVVIILAFEVLLTFFVGSELMHFEDEWFLRIIISGGFAQLLIMPFTLTKFLFNTESELSKE